MKKNKKIIVVVGIIITIFVSLFLYIVSRPVYSFDECILFDNEKEYEQIAKLCYKDYKKNNNGSVNVYLFSDENKIYRISGEKNNKEYIDMDKEEINAVSVINKTFCIRKQSFNQIDVYENYVSFIPMAFNVSLVYSVDGSKPEYISRPDEIYDGRIYVKKIKGNWYFVSETLSL